MGLVVLNTALVVGTKVRCSVVGIQRPANDLRATSEWNKFFFFFCSDCNYNNWIDTSKSPQMYHKLFLEKWSHVLLLGLCVRLNLSSKFIIRKNNVPQYIVYLFFWSNGQFLFLSLLFTSAVHSSSHLQRNKIENDDKKSDTITRCVTWSVTYGIHCHFVWFVFPVISQYPVLKQRR